MVKIKPGTCFDCLVAVEQDCRGKIQGYDWVLDVMGSPALEHWAHEIKVRELGDFRATEYAAACGVSFAVARNIGKR